MSRYTQLYRDRLRFDRQGKCVTIQILYRERGKGGEQALGAQAGAYMWRRAGAQGR